MNNFNTFLPNKQQTWQEQAIDWPLAKPKEQIKEEIWQSIENDIKSFAKALIENILEQTIKEHLQLDKYERSRSRQDYRNGYYERKMQTRYGTIDDLAVPRLRNSQPDFNLFDKYETRQPKIDQLIGQLYLAGISTKRLKGIVRELTGRELSHSTISNINVEIFEKTLTQFQSKPITDDIKYLLIDGIRQPIKDIFGYQDKVGLAAYGIKENGERGLISLRIVNSENEQDAAAFLADLKERGLRGEQLKLITVDGAKGLKKAIETIYPFKPVQGCWVHKMRNIAAKTKHSLKKAVLSGVKEIFNAPNKQEALNRFRVWKSQWHVLAEKAVHCLEKDLVLMLNFYDCPEEDWVMIRSTNYLERAFREIRRRTNSISSFPNAKSAERVMVAFSEAFIFQPAPLEFTQDT
jgi:putative transposase